jgi:hypothetical protein
MQTRHDLSSLKIVKKNRRALRSFATIATAALIGLTGWPQLVQAQDILSSQLRQSLGKNKVRYKEFDWWILESEHLSLHYEPEFDDLAHRAIQYLEEGYDHISEIMRHDLSTKPPIIIYKSHYDFQQTNIIHQFLPPGVAGFAEPLRYRMVIPFAGDLDEFRNVLVHELMHIFQYDVLYKGPIKRLSGKLSAPPTWIMEGMAEYSTPGTSTIDEMVLRDAVLTDQLIPLEVMDSFWGAGNVFLAYKQSHSIMEYIAANYGPEKITRMLRAWDSQGDTDRLLKRLIDMDMETLDERWAAHMRKKYWPLLQTRDYLSELATKVAKEQSKTRAFLNPRWSLSGDMLAVLSTDGVEQHVDIIRLSDGSLVERVTSHMRATKFDQLTFGEGTVDWAPDGHTIAFVAKEGPKDMIWLWDLYDKQLKNNIVFDNLEIIESLAWSPDSRQLAFVGTGSGQSDIYIIDLDTGNLEQITGTPEREDYPAWSPDGQSLAYSAKQNNQYDIKIRDFASGKTHVAIQSPTDDIWPNWLPEGNKILFVSTRERINDLFLYHLEEGREYRLTRTISGIMSPALSPDGKDIVLTTYYRGRRKLYRMEMPAWPEVKKRSADLLARTGETLLLAGKVGAEETSLIDTTAFTPSAAPLKEALTSVNLEDAVALLEQKAQNNKAVKLADDADPFVADAPTLTDVVPPMGGSGIGDRPEHLASTSAQLSSAGQTDLSLDNISNLPRHRYTPKLEFDGLALQMGYFDGFFSSVAQLSMSDLLGNHSLSMATDYLASQEIDNDFNFAVDYTYYGNRPTYHVSLFNWSQFFNDRNTDSFYIYRGQLVRGLERSRQTGLLADISYPLDIFRRIELSYTYVDEQRELVFPIIEPRGGFATHLFRAAYVHDSVTYGLLGPTTGRGYFISVGRAVTLSNGDRRFSHLEADYRQYKRLGRWSVFGLRLMGIGSLGRDGLQYNLGGPAWFLPFFSGFNLNTGPLRGYSYSELTGSRVVLMNSEVRVPFIRNITFGWPGTFAIPAVDGSFFFDLGTAWNKGDKLEVWPLYTPGSGAEPMGERRLRGTFGFGTLVYFILPMNFEFARQTDLQGEYSDWQFHFSFGKSF